VGVTIARHFSVISMERIKIIFVGDCAVGKTSIINYYAKKSTSNISPTAGLQATSVEVLVGGVPTILSIWDTAGQERFRALIPCYFHEANVVVLVCDHTLRSSVDGLSAWSSLIDSHAPEAVVRVLVVNKQDLSDTTVTSEEVAALGLTIEAREIFQTSAVSGLGINALFEWITSPEIPRDRTHMSGITEENRLAILTPDNSCSC
jgi:small GTP-binding protein